MREVSYYGERMHIIKKLEYTKPTKPTIPCIENKCLKFPVCRNKDIIICDLLLKRYKEIEEEGSWDAWDVIRDWFGRLHNIRLPDHEYSVMKEV